MANIINLFPSIAYTDMVYLNDNIMEKVKSFEYERMYADNGSYTKNKYVLEELPDVKNQIQKIVDKYIHEIHSVVDHQKFELMNSWVNIHKPNDWAQRHDHANSVLSGVLFLEVPEKSGAFIIHREHKNFVDNCIRLDYKHQNEYNTYDVKFKPKKGGLILFPSWVIHSVTKNESEQNRYTLAFNYYPRGKFGSQEHTLKL